MERGWWPSAREGDLVLYLSDEEQARLLGAMEEIAAPAGQPLFRKGEPAEGLYLVESGEIEVYDAAMGEELTLAVVGTGGVVGEVGFVDGRARTHDVRARGACLLRRLTRERLLELVRNDPLLFAKLTIALAELLARRFRRAVEELEPVRAFAATLQEPMAHDPAAAFDEIDDPLPAPAGAEAAQMLELVKAVGRGSKDLAGV